MALAAPSTAARCLGVEPVAGIVDRVIIASTSLAGQSRDIRFRGRHWDRAVFRITRMIFDIGNRDGENSTGLGAVAGLV